MGVLDELKREAQAVEARRNSEQTMRDVMKRKVVESLLPHLRQLHTYFTEFQRHLTVVDPKVLVSYELKGASTLTELRQCEYKVSFDATKELDRFQFTFRCMKQGTVEVTQRDTASAVEFQNLIKANGLRAKVRDLGRGASQFQLEAVVPVLLDFKLDPEREAIQLTIRNLRQLGTTRFTLYPDRIDGELMDAIANLILRRDSDFDELMGNRMTETGIYRIRKQLDTVTNPEVPIVETVDPRARKRSEKKPGAKKGGLFGAFTRR